MKMAIFYPFLLLLIQKVASNNCPVSSIINTESDGIMSYPIDLFAPNSPKRRRLSSHKSKGDYDDLRCSYIVPTKGEEVEYFGQCSSTAMCPVSDVEASVAVTTSKGWMTSHSLCYLREALQTPDESVNVIFVGGSMTFGSLTEGCCCSSALNPICSSFDYNPYSQDPADHIHLSRNVYCRHDAASSRRCAWGIHLSRWIRSLSVSPVKHHMFAYGGTSSILMAEMFHDFYVKSNIGRKLTRSDIVFIDLSVNDYHQVIDNPALGTLNGLHGIMENILSASENGSWPSIIILETFPYPKPNEEMRVKYYEIYRAISQRYQIPLWSYRDVVWNYLDHSKSKFNHNALDLLMFKEKSYHPPWFTHLYIADVFGNVLRNEFRQCQYNSTSNSYLNQKRVEDMDIHKYSAIFQKLSGCEGIDQYFLDISALELSDSTAEFRQGKVAMDPPNSWPLLEDRPGKFGWIDEDQAVSETCSHTYTSRIIFPINMTAYHPDVTRSFKLTIIYLATYFNAGKADLYICNNYVDTLDALHEGHKHNHVSVSKRWYQERGIHDLLQWCDGHLNDATLELRRYCQAKSEASNEESAARSLNKFKLISLRVCPLT